MNRDFSGLCLKDCTFDTENISDIILLKVFVTVLPDLIPCHICLNLALKNLNVTERSGSYDPQNKTFSFTCKVNGNEVESYLILATASEE